MDSNNSSSRRICRHDVFLSFRGPDTRNTFTDHLYHRLVRKGIFVFRDDQSLQKGETISPQLLQAIRDSRVSVVVFSKNYASSTWCLDEMATIADCHEQLQLTVFPVFYDVDPSHVRNPFWGAYRDAFVSHFEKFKHDSSRVSRWTTAMKDLGNLVGFDVRDKPEDAETEKVVRAVIKALGHRFPKPDDLIGMQPRVEESEKLLKLSSVEDDFRVLGIWGMGGVGKTTLATFLYDRISYRFDARCFIENLSKVYGDGGVVAVQKQILRQALDEKDIDTYDTCEISGIVVNRLHDSIKILLVFDNVDQIEQLQELGINPKFLCRGSRMIITTRDVHILRVYGADEVHEVPLLNSNDARELFCKKAFRSEEQSSSCVELIPEVLRYCQRLPLAIKVVGSFLCARDATQWSDALDRYLRNNPDNKVMDVLEMSVAGLSDKEIDIFLDIACFFKGEREDYVKRILYACGLNPHIGIQRILEKSLITITNQEIHMHEMLQELGKKIVRRQFPKKPESWSRLWRYEDFYHAMMTEKETNNVEAIVLDQKENVSNCGAEGFSYMRNLELLILHRNNFSGNLNFLSNNLRYLLWHGHPFTSLPSSFEPYYLVELNMPDSCIQRLWEGRKNLPYFERMDLSNSKYLIETPNLRGTPKLKRLDFTGCTNLSLVHPSIGHLTELAFLSMQNCSSLVSLDFGSASNLSFLRVLRLSGCTKLEAIPDFTEASNLEYLDMDGCTSLSTVHESIGALAKLRFLSLRDCTNLVGLPGSISTMTSLVTLDLCGCSKLTTLPQEWTLRPPSYLKSLIFLDVSFCNLSKVPDAIGALQSLERLNLQGNNFDSLPSSIGRLRCLTYLNLAHCHELQIIPPLPVPHSRASSAGRYFKTVSGSRDHRSGLYIFDCPKMKSPQMKPQHKHRYLRNEYPGQWLYRQARHPNSFRCGFDIIVPSEWENIDSPSSCPIPEWFNHKFDGGSVIRIVQSDAYVRTCDFAFCVAFEVNSRSKNSGSPHDSPVTPLPHPFYLSFESEHTEERFDMPLNLELDKTDGSKHLWLIYISQEHCHFVKTGACITFKACPGLTIKKWGLRVVHYLKVPTSPDGSRTASKEIIFDKVELAEYDRDHRLVFDHVEGRSGGSGPKIQLPYNWLITKQEEAENYEAKSKENALSNLGI